MRRRHRRQSQVEPVARSWQRHQKRDYHRPEGPLDCPSRLRADPMVCGKFGAHAGPALLHFWIERRPAPCVTHQPSSQWSAAPRSNPNPKFGAVETHFVTVYKLVSSGSSVGVRTAVDQALGAAAVVSRTTRLCSSVMFTRVSIRPSMMPISNSTARRPISCIG